MLANEYFRLKAEELKPKLKQFPASFIEGNSGKKFQLPGKTIILGKEFFGNYEVTTHDGTPWYTSDNLFEAKFLIYSCQNGLNEVVVPSDKKMMSFAVSQYEQYLDLLMKEIRDDFTKKFPDTVSSEGVTNVFRMLNLVRY